MVPVSQRVMNLAVFLRQTARRLPDELGLVRGDDHWTWREMDERVDAMAAALRAAGIGKGDRVIVQARNSNQMFESLFVCFRLGAVWVPTNFRQTPAEVAYLAESSGARGLIWDAAFPDHAAAVRQAANPLTAEVVIGRNGDQQDYDSLVERHRGTIVQDEAVNRDDPCWFFFTSGTTGRPKAAVLTHGQMGFVITNHLADLMPGLRSDRDASLVVAPLSHAAGIHQMAQVARGVKSVLTSGDRLDPDEAWRLVERWRITNMFAVPTIVKILTESNAVDRYDHSSLRHLIYAGAPMYREDQKHALDKLDRVMVQYFGLGEVTGNITVMPAHLHDPSPAGDALAPSCGYARTGMELSIQDDEGNELPPGVTGEVCVCGLAVFAGYHDNPEANAKAFRNGWFRTGDLGHLDDHGFLFITGRASDMYISGGSNIYPREIEEKMLTHPAVAEVAVLGIPDARWGEVGAAIVVLRPDESCDEAALIAHIEGSVARYKLPRLIAFWDALPKSGYGKISKRIVRDEMVARGLIPAVGRDAI